MLGRVTVRPEMLSGCSQDARRWLVPGLEAWGWRGGCCRGAPFAGTRGPPGTAGTRVPLPAVSLPRGMVLRWARLRQLHVAAPFPGAGFGSTASTAQPGCSERQRRAAVTLNILLLLMNC